MEKEKSVTTTEKRIYKHALFGRRLCFESRVIILWTERASWRFIFLRSKLWKELSQEIYQMIDQKLVKNVYKCSVCGITKDCPFVCKGE